MGPVQVWPLAGRPSGAVVLVDVMGRAVPAGAVAGPLAPWLVLTAALNGSALLLRP
jgi:hypothetical protein